MYYETYLSTWYPEGNPLFYFNYLVMPASVRDEDADRDKWTKDISGNIVLRNVKPLPPYSNLFKWDFDINTGLVALRQLPVTPVFPIKDKVWIPDFMDTVKLNNMPNFFGWSVNPGIGVAGDLVIKEKNGNETTFTFWYASMYSSLDLRGNMLYAIVDGKDAVCLVDNFNNFETLYLGFDGMHL